MNVTHDLQLSPDGEPILPSEWDVPVSLRESFRQGLGPGVIAVAGLEQDFSFPPFLTFWRSFGRSFLTQISQRLSGEQSWVPIPPPSKEDLKSIALTLPPASGAEYVDSDFLLKVWDSLNEIVRRELSEGISLEDWLTQRGPIWNQLGKITFHLAENPRDEEHPFAFLATYTHKLSDQSTLQHLPLGNAIRRFAQKKDQGLLKSILSPLRDAARTCVFVKGLLDTKQVFQALPWNPTEAYRLLESIPIIESCGITVKVPNWWKAGRPPRPKVSIKLDASNLTLGGVQTLLSFSISKTLNGEKLNDEEWKKLINSSAGLVSIKGQWVEVDAAKLEQALAHWKKVELARASAGITFAQGMRMLAGFRQADFALKGGDDSTKLDHWTEVAPDEGLETLLNDLRDRNCTVSVPPEIQFRATLRPYQKDGFQWLRQMRKLGLGACLADDMGLGKTVQVIAALVAEAPEQANPNLLIVPASLLGNWNQELKRFAPKLRPLFAHPSTATKSELRNPNLDSVDLVISTYSMMTRLPFIAERDWNILVIDEAQALKNPSSSQTRAAKELRAQHRIALTGTPVENSVSDLWSLFDFLNPGLLGTASDFKAAIQAMNQQGRGYGPLRQLISPYILRRLKTDPSIISDLPEKTELDAFCPLSKSQTAIYQQHVQQLAKDLEAPESSGIQRNGLVLSYLLKFKQICDHPGLLTGSGNFEEKHSGKFKRLRAIVEELFARGEKVLVFTQFREMTDPLTELLNTVAPRSGISLHGGTSVTKRQELVTQFQEPEGPPFFVISLKAGGTGLNLTAASHVVHFDRWWNPAVEIKRLTERFALAKSAMCSSTGSYPQAPLKNVSTN